MSEHLVVGDVVGGDLRAPGQRVARRRREHARRRDRELARTLIRLGVVDRYHLYVYPVVSPGDSWFGEIRGQQGLELQSATAYSNGVVGLYYA